MFANICTATERQQELIQHLFSLLLPVPLLFRPVLRLRAGRGRQRFELRPADVEPLCLMLFKFDGVRSDNCCCPTWLCVAYIILQRGGCDGSLPHPTHTHTHTHILSLTHTHTHILNIHIHLCLCVCARRCGHVYSCCGDINLITHSHCGDSPPIWGQNSSPHNVNHCISV